MADKTENANGSLANGHATTTNNKKSMVKRKSRSSTGLVSNLSSNFLRILLWSSIAYVFLQCPSSPADLTKDSNAICKQYVGLRSQIAPHVAPYYNSYVDPYVQQAKPHLDRFNQQVYTPTSTFVAGKYDIYAAPRVHRAREYATAQWEKSVYPQLQGARQVALTKYNDLLSPHVTKVVDASDPYVVKAKDEINDIYEGTLMPLYKKTEPWIQNAYHQTRHVTVDVAYPHMDRFRLATTAILAQKVWPVLVTVYGENVEPQVTRIIERLGRFKDSKKLKAAIHAQNTAASITSAAAHASSVAADEARASKAHRAGTNASVASKKPGKAESPAEIRKKIDADLKQWQDKFAKAADKGSEDLNQRVEQITSRQIENQAHRVGQALVLQLDNTINSSISDLKTLISSSVAKLPAEPTESAEDIVSKELNNGIKSTGEKIRSKAIAVQQWKINYDDDTSSLVMAALNSTLEVIDNIREVGLQEMGVQWAYMEGVTYKDWSLYHDLKKSFDHWRIAVEAVALEHAGLNKARQEGQAVQEKALDSAGAAAKELIRLQGVVAWKVAEHDSSDDFSSKSVPRKIVKAAQGVLSQGSESLSSLFAHASEEIKEELPVSDPVLASSLTDSIKIAASTASSRISEASPELAQLQSKASIIASSASKSAASAVSVASSIASDAASSGSNYASDAASKGSSYASEKIETVSEQASSQAPKVWGGVSAGFVEGRQVLLEEELEETWSDKISSILDEAGDKASALTSAVSQALSRPTSIQGSVESMTSLASKQYAEALSAASSVMFGTRQPAVESLSSAASDKLAAAVTAASYAIYGTPKPIAESLGSQANSAYGTAAASASSVLSSISSVASVRLSEGLSQASAQYTNAKIAVGAQPPPVHQQYISDAQRKYYEGIGIAHERYTQFISAASGAVYGSPTPVYQSLASQASAKIMGTPIPAYESMTSAARKQYSDAIAAASSQLASAQVSASSMMGMKKNSPAKKILDSASSQYDAVFATASENLVYAASVASVKFYGTEQGTFASVSSVLSEGIVGTETPWNEAAASKASVNFDALLSKASEQIYGAPTPLPASIYNQAGEYASQATDVAASQYSAVRNVVSELLMGKEPDFTESVMNQLSSAYYTGAWAVVASASSAASEAYDSATSVAGEVYESASSVVSAVFTPPAALEGLIESANKQLEGAVAAASAQIYGTTKGTIEKASSAVSDAYESAQSAASEAIYGTQPGFLESVQSNLAAMASSGQRTASEVIYGTPTGVVEDATNSAASAYSQATSIAAENLSAAGGVVKDTYSSVSSQVSYAVYGPRDGTWESASSRISVAAASASAQIAKMIADASSAAADSVGNVASSASSVASSVTSRVKDEL